MADLSRLSLADLSRLIEAKALSPVELTQTYMNRIADIDAQIHSFNHVRHDEAMAEAIEAERRIIQGDRLGPLDGIPIGIKDLIDVEGLPTTAQAAHRRNAIAQADADVVTMLKRAGAIILGKQATAEYAVGGTQFDLPWPPTRNPWNRDLDPSSSSSGSAASVAAGLCAGSVGTETAGSIRDPAAWCGVAGLKPTNGLVSTRGVLPLSPSMDCVGPIAWTVEDCALMLSPMVSPKSAGVSIGSDVRGLRVGVVRHFYEDDPEVDDDVVDAMENSLAAFEGLGVELCTVRLREFDLYCAVARKISWPEEYEEHRAELEAYPDRFSAVSRSRLEDGKGVSAADYIAARKQQVTLTGELAGLMRDVDVLVLPTNKRPAQVLGYEHTALGNIEMSLTRPFNLTGGPALSLCNGFTASGLPTSIQIIGRSFEDETVLAVGHALEIVLGLRSRRPELW